jgi:hypothetical protein
MLAKKKERKKHKEKEHAMGKIRNLLPTVH